MITDDEAGFDEFVAARSGALTRTAHLLTGDHHLAQDLLQAALIQTARHWARIHTSPEAYVRRTMYHQNISWWRRRRLVETPLMAHDGAERSSDPDLRLTLDQALARLTPKQRTVLVLRFYEDLTYADIGMVLGCPEATARSHVHRALAALRGRLSPGDVR